MRILLIGPPGGGKGTQATMLKERFGMVHLASGDIFRAELREQTALGKIAQQYMNQGELVPDQITIDMMAKRLMTPEAREKGFILDGFPRTVPQAEALDRLLNSLNMPLQAVISIDVDDDVLVERISGRLSCVECGAVYHVTANPPKQAGVCDKCGGKLVQRPDDHPETVRERLRVFHKATAPVLDYYARKGALSRIDGSKSPTQVFEAILRSVSA